LLGKKIRRFKTAKVNGIILQQEYVELLWREKGSEVLSRMSPASKNESEEQS